jgi:hypothetical protein
MESEMRKFITANFFLVAAYLTVYMGDYSHAYIVNTTNGWGVTDYGNKLAGGPGWFGGIMVLLGIIGIISCMILIARIADENENLSELNLVGHGVGLLAAAWAFGAISGPFTAWGFNPQEWLKSHLSVFVIICAWPFVYEGLVGLFDSFKQVAKNIRAEEVARASRGVALVKSDTRSA